MKKVLKVGVVHLTMTDVVLIKIGISLGIAAAFYLPHPWSIAAGLTSNMIWIWRL